MHPESRVIRARRFLLLLFCVGASVVYVGCHKDAAIEAGDSDANGYLCTKCGEKICTDRKVFAEQCPKCKSVEITEVVAFVCNKDNHMTLLPRRREAAVCEQCNSRITAIKLPREQELRAWGAIKRSKAEVIQK
jgi:DNA-directed RNA polymerase subunit RPC12/RpoP